MPTSFAPFAHTHTGWPPFQSRVMFKAFQKISFLVLTPSSLGVACSTLIYVWNCLQWCLWTHFPLVFSRCIGVLLHKLLSWLSFFHLFTFQSHFQILTNFLVIFSPCHSLFMSLFRIYKIVELHFWGISFCFPNLMSVCYLLCHPPGFNTCLFLCFLIIASAYLFVYICITEAWLVLCNTCKLVCLPAFTLSSFSELVFSLWRLDAFFSDIQCYVMPE